MRFLAVLAVFLASGSICTSAHGETRYKCNGEFRMRPCTVRQELPRSEVAALARITEVKLSISPKIASEDNSDITSFAKIINPAFVRLDKRDGLWKGKVQGNGLIRMELHILRNGIFESRRSMGSVRLKNKTTPFNFRSVIPRGAGWSWEIRVSTVG